MTHLRLRSCLATKLLLPLRGFPALLFLVALLPRFTRNGTRPPRRRRSLGCIVHRFPRRRVLLFCLGLITRPPRLPRLGASEKKRLRSRTRPSHSNTHFDAPFARARDAFRFAGGDLPSLSRGSRFFSYTAQRVHGSRTPPESGLPRTLVAAVGLCPLISFNHVVVSSDRYCVLTTCNMFQ